MNDYNKSKYLNMSPFSTDEGAYEQIAKTKRALAEYINKMSLLVEQFSTMCECQGWDDMVTCDMKDSMRIAGVSLATLSDWYEPEEEERILKKIYSK